MLPVVRSSSLDQTILCHGAPTLLARVAPRQGSESFEGSLLHWETAGCLTKFLGAVGDRGKRPVPDSYKLPKSSEWMITWFLAQVKETVPDDWSLEVEVALAYAFARFLLSGHLDMLAVSPDGKKAKGKDWKTGYRAVDPAEFNYQVLSYIVLIKRAFPDVEEIEFEICQPRACEDAGEQRVSTVTLKGADLDKAVAFLEKKVNEALDDPMSLETGITQCAWCAGALQCPAIQKLIAYMKATLTPELLARIRAVPDDPTLAEFVIAAKTLDRVFEDAKDLLKERLGDNGRITSTSGVSVTQEVQGGRWSVEDPAGMFEAVMAALPQGSVAKVVTYSTDRLKDEIATSRGIPKKSKAGDSAEKVFIERFTRYMKQGERRVLKFS
jgi:hypothetical protein